MTKANDSNQQPRVFAGVPSGSAKGVGASRGSGTAAAGRMGTTGADGSYGDIQRKDPSISNSAGIRPADQRGGDSSLVVSAKEMPLGTANHQSQHPGPLLPSEPVASPLIRQQRAIGPGDEGVSGCVSGVKLWPAHLEHMIDLFADRSLKPGDAAVFWGLLAHVDLESGHIHVTLATLAEELGTRLYGCVRAVDRLRKQKLLAKVTDKRTGDNRYYLFNPQLASVGGPERRKALQAQFDAALV